MSHISTNFIIDPSIPLPASSYFSCYGTDTESADVRIHLYTIFTFFSVAVMKIYGFIIFATFRIYICEDEKKK